MPEIDLGEAVRGLFAWRDLFAVAMGMVGSFAYEWQAL
jgi:hypothetical protein